MNSSEEQDNKNDSFGNTLSYTFPLNRFNTTLSYSSFTYHQTIGDIASTLDTKGISDTCALDITHKTWHSRHHRIELGAGYSYKSNESYISGILIDSQTYKHAVAEASLKYSYYSSNFEGYLLYRFHNGRKDFSAESNFRKNTLDASTTFHMLDKSQLKYNISLHAQQTEDELAGTEKIGVGGFYSVRGFNLSGLSGDNGYYLRSDLAYSFKGNNTTLSPYLGFDYGYVKEDGSSIYGEISGGAVGVRIHQDDILIDILTHIPLNDNSFTERADKFLGFTASFGF